MALKLIRGTRWNKPGRFIRRRGGSLLEAAVVLPVLLYLAFGTVEFGYYFYVKHSCEGAAREGARAAIVAGSAYSDVTSAVSTAMGAASLSGSGFSTTVKDNGTTITTLTSVATGDTIEVTVSCNWSTVGSGYSAFGFIGSSKVISGVATMRHE
jgi:Flp pilus assembly protein TadG